MTLDELTLLVSESSEVAFTARLDGVSAWVSPGVAGLAGWTPGEMIGHPFTDFVHPDDRQAVRDGRAAADSGGTRRFRLRLLLKDGGYRWVDVLLRTRFDDAGVAVQRFGSWRDAEEEMRLQSSLRAALSGSVRSAERLRATMDSMLDPHVCLEAVRDDAGMAVDFVFVDANPAAEAFNGVGAGGLVGVLLLGKHPAAGVTTFFDDCVRVVESGEPMIRDDWTYPQDMRGGELRRYDVRGVRLGDGLSLTWRDVTGRFEAAERLAESARFDLLTGLMSRSETLRYIDLLLSQRAHAAGHVALLFCDVDRFKDVNDAHGHAAGDEVLRALGGRLRSAIRSGDLAGRIGGDEFLIALTGVRGIDEAVAIAGSIRATACKPVDFERGMGITPSVSIGVALAQPGEMTDDLLRRADFAMYEAKRAGRDPVIAVK